MWLLSHIFPKSSWTFVIKLKHMFFKRKPKTPKSYAIEVTEENFKELVMQSEKPVLIDFWASWCGPCKILGPIVDELSGEYEGKAVIGKINTEQQQRLAATFQIRNIPTLMIFKEGKLVERFSGVVPKPNLEEILDSYIDWTILHTFKVGMWTIHAHFT